MTKLQNPAADPKKRPLKSDNTRYDILPTPMKIVFVVFSMFGVAMGIFFILGLNIGGFVLINTAYYYALFALFECLIFLIMPMRQKDADHVPWYDYLLAVITFLLGVYVFANSWEISQTGWIPAPTSMANIAAIALCLIALEGGRRMAGIPFTLVCLFFFLYPMIADYMPGMLWGMSFSPQNVVSFIVYGSQGMLGLPGMVMGDILIGFLLFAGILIASGGGKFFLDFSVSLFGRFRGGPAKVAVMGSGLFGSLSGSPISNVVGTGSITIPAMKKIGYPPHYAGAIEATASTGGVIMPPVMGSVAFIMAVIIGMDYATIVIAACIPAFLYYFGLLMQVDAFAAKTGLKGMPRSEVPPVREAMKKGWAMVIVLLFFVWGLLYMRWEAATPIYSAGLLFLLSFFSRTDRMNFSKLVETFVVIGKLIAQTTAILLPAAFIIGGFVLTGVSAALAGGFIELGGGQVIPILLMGVLASFVLGMIGLGGYIFLAVTMAPALVQLGLDIISVHLFILYYSLMSLITPPVAVCAFLGANIAGANPMRTAWAAVRLGVVLLFIPFFFVFNPALVLRAGTIWETAYLLTYCLVGIAVLAGGLEGYLVFFGKVAKWARPLFVVGGFFIAYPDTWKTAGFGFAVTILGMIITLILRSREPKPVPIPSEGADRVMV